MYGAALKQLETKIDIINNEFKTLHKYNPIEHVSSRIKSKESINKKLKKKGGGALFQGSRSGAPWFTDSQTTVQHRKRPGEEI